MKKRALLVGSIAIGLAGAASAEPKKPDPTPPPTTTPPAPLHQSALAHVATEIARELGQVPPGTIVVASPLTTDVAAPKGDELAVRIATQIAGRLGTAKASDKPAPIAVARGISGRAASLVYVQLEIAKGELRATADLYPVVSNGWERLRNPVPGPRAHAFATAPIDAEIRGFLTPLLLEQAQIHKAKHEEGEVIAVGCGDIDGDGGNDLVIVTRTRVSIGRLRGGKFVADKSTPWRELASRTPVPEREPLGSVVISHGEALIGTTDRGGVAVDSTLVAKRQLAGLPVPGGEGELCAIPSPESGALEATAVPCVPSTPGNVLSLATARYDAVAMFDAVQRDGSVSEIVATREPSAKLRVRRRDPGSAKPAEVTIDNVGAQLAVVDLDLDGTPEVVTTAEGEADTIVISSFAKSQLTARLRIPAREGVRALGVCPPEEHGAPAIVAVVGSEVWLVR